jgi:hypothetical protein
MALEELKRLPPEELRRRYRDALGLRLPDGKADY